MAKYNCNCPEVCYNRFIGNPYARKGVWTMRRILCSTGALITAKNNRDYRLLREMTPKIKCDGYEFLMYDSWYPEWEKVAREVAGMNLQIHSGAPRG